jgi:enoyl-CoA hydratase
MPETGKMLAHKDGTIGWLIFDNPAKHNAVSFEMWSDLARRLEEFAADPAVRVVVLAGAGNRAFVSGADISRFEEERASAEATARYSAAVDAAFTALYDVAKPTIAMIRGYCLGGGVGVATCCDLRIASADARLGIPAARLGLGYGYRAMKRLVDIVGPAFAKEMLFTARRFTGDEARAMGLVNRVVANAELETVVKETAETIAANAPLTIEAAKRAIGEAVKEDSERDTAAIDALVKVCFESEDYKEGRTAFVEKRQARFKGK